MSVLRRSALLISLAMMASPAVTPLHGQSTQLAAARDLRRLSIEELAQIRVTSVSKSVEPLQEAAASIFVISQDAIRRSGASNIPEILRLAPNLQVARLDANTYAITARGFNQSGGTANKLLVLIDGRPVYSPLFSGTFWDAQRTFVEDIDRIEVISGPGGTLWGANAVNGVINIITRSSDQTRGWSLDARGGSLDRRLGTRYGFRLTDRATVRISGLAINQGSMVSHDGTSMDDSWNHIQSGFRADWNGSHDSVTLQGDLYRGTGIGHPLVLPSGTNRGGNLVATWRRTLASGASLQLLSFADRSRRILVSGIDARIDQRALEAQVDFKPGQRHAVVIGAGYRTTEDEFQPGLHTAFLSPAERTLAFGNVFVHDTIKLSEALKFYVGLKAENNTYTGLEWMPEARLAWKVSDRAMFWGSAARAVRTPSRFDTDLVNPGVLTGNMAFRSENLRAFEAGCRVLATDVASISFSAFYNSYDDLRSVEASGPTIFPLVLRNGMLGHTEGVEAWADFEVRSWWRVGAGASVLRKHLRFEPGSADLFGVSFAGNDPGHQWQLRSSMDFPRDVTVDLWMRGVGALPNPRVPAYREADIHVGWQSSEHLELGLDLQNLLHDQHLEFVNPSLPPSEIPRAVTLTARWFQ